MSSIMGKSESIEALLSPSLRVSRPVAACSRCRTAKIKCDGKLPVCTACEKSGKASSCTSANDDFARGKERSYVSALEATAERLRKKIEKAQSISNSSNTASQPQEPTTSLDQSRKTSRGHRKEALDVDELVGDFGFLTVNATSRDFHGFTSTMSFSKLLLAVAVKKPLPTNEERPLPSRSVLTPAIDRYLNTIYVLLPFFSETELMSSISRVYQDPSVSVPVAPIDLWYIRMISAVSAATQTHERGDEKDKFALQNIAAAMDLADYVLHPGSIVGIQALLLLVVYSLSDPEYFDSWYLIGLASRLLVDLGLHCEPSSETKISKEALDIRRRIFHCTYALDRLISMSTGRAFSFTDDSASCMPLPVLESKSKTPDTGYVFLRSLKPCLYLFDIRRVQSAFYQLTVCSSRSQWSSTAAARYMNSVSKDIQSWYDTIPQSLPRPLSTFFNLERLYSQILVLSPNQKRPIVNMTKLDKGLVFEYSAQYAEVLQPVTLHVSEHGLLRYTDIQRARYVGNQFLEVMWSDFDGLLKSQHVLAGWIDSADATPFDNCVRAITCLENITEILEFGRRRWNLRDMLDDFERESAVLLNRLRNRQHDFGTSQPVDAKINFSHDPIGQHYQVGSFQDSQSQQINDSVTGQKTKTPGNGASLQNLGTMPLPEHFDPLQNSEHNLPQGTLPRRSYEFIGGRS